MSSTAAVEAPSRFAELHLHLGGAILPRILYSYIERELAADPDSVFAHTARQIRSAYPEYEAFEERLTRPSASLMEFLERFSTVEALQTVESLPYFIYRLLRGASVFEGISYMEVRYNPFFRIPKDTSREQVVEKMQEVVSTIHQAALNAQRLFPIQFTQILCMDSRLPVDLNRAILDVAADMRDPVCGVDLAGPNEPYEAKEDDFVRLFEHARDLNLKSTAHVFETTSGCLEKLLPLVDRIGHGIQIPLRYRNLLVGVANRKQCLEICPTTYLRTGTLKSYRDLRPVFERCFDLGVDVAICTDNMALNDVRLPREYELLLLNRVLSFSEMERCRLAAFRHAFRYEASAYVPSRHSA